MTKTEQFACFRSFEAAIANTISSFKGRKTIYIVTDWNFGNF